MKVLITIISFSITLLFCPINSAAQTVLTVQQGKPTLDGVISPGEWTSSSLTTTRGVTLWAMADGDSLYLAASWQDATENNAPNRLTYSGSQWSKAEDEDRIAFLFDMGQTGADGVNCQAFCHFPGMSTNGGTVDVWNWQAGRSNPMGYSEDSYWDAAGQHVDAGVSAVLVNQLDAGNLPTFMATTDPGAIKKFLAENTAAKDAFDPFNTLPAQSVEEAVSFNNAASFNANDYIAGYIHRIPTGDIADVRSAGKYNNGVWTVEFSRSFEGGEHDFTVEPGGLVSFAHEVFDNQGSNHAIDSTPIDATSYTLDFSLITATDIEQVDESTPGSFGLTQNFPNPFSTSTTIGFQIQRPGIIQLQIINVLGEVVKTLSNEHFQAGAYEMKVDFDNLPSGIYYYRLSTDHFSQTRQMTYLK